MPPQCSAAPPPGPGHRQRQSGRRDRSRRGARHSVVVGFLIPSDADTGSGTSPVEVGQHIRKQSAEDRPQVLRPEPGRSGGGLCDPHRLGGLDDDVGTVHHGAPFECSEVRFDSAESGLLVGHGLLDLGLANAQHAPQLIERRLRIEQPADLLEAEAEIPQRQEPVEPAPLGHGIGPISRCRVDPAGLEQSQLVVVAQHPGRDLSESGELSDVQHDDLSDPPSHRGKVKREFSWLGTSRAARSAPPTTGWSRSLSGPPGERPSRWSAADQPRGSVPGDTQRQAWARRDRDRPPETAENRQSGSRVVLSSTTASPKPSGRVRSRRRSAAGSESTPAPARNSAHELTPPPTPTENAEPLSRDRRSQCVTSRSVRH